MSLVTQVWSLLYAPFPENSSCYERQAPDLNAHCLETRWCCADAGTSSCVDPQTQAIGCAHCAVAQSARQAAVLLCALRVSA